MRWVGAKRTALVGVAALTLPGSRCTELAIGRVGARVLCPAGQVQVKLSL